MIRALLAVSLLPLVAAIDFSTSVILTSADVAQDTPLALNSLTSGDTYRVYATYASGNSEDYARNVVVYDDTGATLNVAGLARAKPGSSYILDDTRILRAPITIHDKNKGNARVPFTVYIVRTDSPTRFPVVSAQLAENDVDSNNGFLAAGLTVLSAEKYFTMSSFDIGNLASMFISSVGFDQSAAQYNMMTLYTPYQASISFLTVYGPVATLFNSDFGWNARFRFTFSRNTPYTANVISGAAFALASPGYLTAGQSYNIPYQIDEALSRKFQFNQENFMEVSAQANDIQQQESIELKVVQADNTVATDMKLQNNANSRQTFYAYTLDFSVVGATANHAPRFLIQVTSGAYSMTLICLLLASLLPNLL